MNRYKLIASFLRLFYLLLMLGPYSSLTCWDDGEIKWEESCEKASGIAFLF